MGTMKDQYDTYRKLKKWSYADAEATYTPASLPREFKELTGWSIQELMNEFFKVRKPFGEEPHD